MPCSPDAHRQVCARCVMDTSDPAIRFDNAGICHHCHDYDAMIAACVPSRDRARVDLDRLVAEVRQRARDLDCDHDCVIGLSGGVDSSFVAWLTHEQGLRPLAVHVDNGWDTELAVQNIERIVTKLGIELHTVVLDWDEFRDLQLAFLRASTPDCEVPTDHAIVSSLYDVARARGIRYILSGCNARTESHLPPAWSRGHDDWRYIKSVQRRFGSRPLTTFPHRTRWRQWRDRQATSWVDVLNLVDYRKRDAINILEKELGWRSYGAKHFESIYTRFFQGYLLPTKFGFDKRRMHLSSLICAGELSREAALAALASPPYPEADRDADVTYVCKKLGIDRSMLEDIMRAPLRSFGDYPSYANATWLRLVRRARGMLRRTRQGTGTP